MLDAGGGEDVTENEGVESDNRSGEGHEEPTSDPQNVSVDVSRFGVKSLVGFIEAPGHDDGSSEHEGSEDRGTLGYHGRNKVKGGQLKHTNDVDESNDSEVLSDSVVSRLEVELLE